MDVRSQRPDTGLPYVLIPCLSRSIPRHCAAVEGLVRVF